MVHLAISSAYDWDQTVFVAAFEGLHFSTNGGTLWHQVDTLHLRMNRAVVISPDFLSDRTLFAGSYGGGVLKSLDGGTTWSFKNTGLINTYTDPLAMSPSFSLDQTLWQGSDWGISRTSNGGEYWNFYPIQPGKKLYPRHLVVSPSFNLDRILYAVVPETIPGVFRSEDAGVTWMPVNRGLPANKTVRSIVISPDFSQDHTLFAGTYLGVFRSTDEGGRWEKVQHLNRYEDSSQLISYQGSWKGYVQPEASNYLIHASRRPGDTAQFDFLGHTIRWIASKGTYVTLDAFEVED